MLLDPVNPLLCFLGLLIWPELTFCIVLWNLGHPLLGIFALLTTFGSGETVVREHVRRG